MQNLHKGRENGKIENSRQSSDAPHGRAGCEDPRIPGARALPNACIYLRSGLPRESSIKNASQDINVFFLISTYAHVSVRPGKKTFGQEAYGNLTERSDLSYDIVDNVLNNNEYRRGRSAWVQWLAVKAESRQRERPRTFHGVGLSHAKALGGIYTFA